MNTTRLSGAAVFLASTLGGLASTHADAPAFIPAEVLKSNGAGELLAGPASPRDFPAWWAGMLEYKRQMREGVATNVAEGADAYANPAVQWARRSFIQPLIMAHERYLYDPAARRYTVARYLRDLNRRYGGIDSVLVWPTYPNIGVDSRNQFDLWRDMPGGLAGLRQMTADFHRQGVRVFIPTMIWDHGTRDEGAPMAERLTQLAKEIGADGLFGDTMSPMSRDFYAESIKRAHPLALEPESGLGDQIEALAWNVLSWGYWWPYQPAPAVDRYKFIEPRHLTHVCDRWAHDHTEILQHAFFNGDGYVSWENIWGIWNEMTPRDAEALHRISAIYRALPELLSSPDFQPFTPAMQSGIYATKFPTQNLTLWTLINRTSETIKGAQLQVRLPAGTKFYDLWHGRELAPQVSKEQAMLAFELEPHGYGAVLAASEPLRQPLKQFLRAMRQRAGVRLSELSNQWRELPQHMVEIPRTRPAPIALDSLNIKQGSNLVHVVSRGAPEGMARIPAGQFNFQVEGVMIEKSEGVDVQYPWEDKPVLKHSHQLAMKTFYIDRTPVTCAEFKRFLDATRYRPKDRHNFLRNWTDGLYPEGWGKKPVTWVGLEDARAYALWAGKRLPHEWEWQYAAQGKDGRLYPWGNEKDDARVPPFDQGREQRPPTDVDAYPQGASPFGVLDLVGNVWQWTDEFQDEHTRTAILKGGSYYRPQKSMWYFPQARQLSQHGKYLLMAPCLDRSATIGFRCVMDAE